MSDAAAIAALAWASLGFSFWLGPHIRMGWPSRWHSGRGARDAGWDEVLLVHLPVCVVGGPIWWVLLVYITWKENA